MKVVILAGGLGTRISEETEIRPKPMVEIGGKPILWHIMKWYSNFGLTEFIICCGYKGHMIKEYFSKYRTLYCDSTYNLANGKVKHHTPACENWSVTCVDTGLDTMTGGRIARIKEYITPGESFLLTYGDGVGNIDLNGLQMFHQEHGRVLTVTGVRPPGRFGELVHSDGVITEFNEKPQATGGRISGGFFVATPKIFNYLDDDEELVFEQKPMRKLVDDKQLMVFEHNGFWQPMDTSREYQLLNSLYDTGDAPWVNW